MAAHSMTRLESSERLPFYHSSYCPAARIKADEFLKGGSFFGSSLNDNLEL